MINFLIARRSSTLGEKRSRKHLLTSNQTKALMNIFQANPYPKLEERYLLAQSLNMRDTSILNWFSNRRRKLKKKGLFSEGENSLVKYVISDDSIYLVFVIWCTCTWTCSPNGTHSYTHAHICSVLSVHSPWGHVSSVFGRSKVYFAIVLLHVSIPCG